MSRTPWRIWILLLIVPFPVLAQQPHADENAPPADAPAPSESYETLSARRAVHEGNALLQDGDADAALQAYAHAESLRPDAPQIPFVQGLAHMARKEFDDARDLFRKAATSHDDRLATDALYAIGATYHKEALENAENPKQAIENLEAAMERYRDVLARDPNHKAARESDYKAASMRRQLRQLLQQQPPQPQEQGGESQNEQDNQDPQGETENQQPSASDEQQQQKDQQNQGDEQQDSQETSDQQENAGQPKNEQHEQTDQQTQESSEQDESESEQKEQPTTAQQEEDISREQAERRLREMMQAIRDKQKQRRHQVRNVPVRTVEKDW